jgi:hypothetical protein
VTAETRVAFYCVSNDTYFLGAVALINSLRLVGHAEPIFVLDCGLSAAQSRLLSSEVTVVRGPDNVPPFLLKTIAPLRHPAEVMILVDADVIVTRPLDTVIDRAAAGEVVAFRNNVDRFVAEWGELLDLGPLERRPYVCSAFLAAGGEGGEEVLRLLDDRQRRVDFERTWWRHREPGYPFLYADQDVLNAVLAARVERSRMVALDHRLCTPMPFEGLEIADAATLRCVFADGTEPYLLHHILPAKPWLRSMHEGVYSRLLRRLVSDSDVAVRPPASWLPFRFRTGAVSFLERKRASAMAQVRWRVGSLVHRLRTALVGLPRAWRRRSA